MSENNENYTQNSENIIQLPIKLYQELRNELLHHEKAEVERIMARDQEVAAMQEGEPTSRFLEISHTEGKTKIKYDHFGQAREIIQDLKIINNKYGMWYYNENTGLWSNDTIPAARELIGRKLGKYATIKRLAETMSVITTTYDKDADELPFDRKLNLIGFANGVYDLNTKVFRNYKSSDYLTTKIPYNFNPNATNTYSDRFLTKLLGDKKQFFFEWIGYSFYRDYCFQYALFLLGNGHNGKSTLIEWYCKVLGVKNVSHITLKDLQENRFMRAGLHKKYANCFADISNEHYRYSDMFKTLTGNDTISCDQKNQGSITFKSHAKLMFSANKMPSFSDKTDGNSRRVLILPMVAKMEVSKVDFMKLLMDPEEVEWVIMQAIKAFEGVLERRAFTITEDMNQAKEDWLENMDYVRSFVQEECELVPNGKVGTSMLFACYQKYCQDSNVASMGKHKFYEHLTVLFPQVLKTRAEAEANGKKPHIFKGITLN